MSKILVIEDWEKFLRDLNVATLKSVCVVADVEVELLKHERKDAIQFEGKVAIITIGDTKQTGLELPPIPQNTGLKKDDPVTVFVFRKGG